MVTKLRSYDIGLEIEGTSSLRLLQNDLNNKDTRRLRMRRLRHSIRKHDIYWWADRFLDSAS